MSKPLFIPPSLFENLIVLDGLTRSGKFLLGKIVSNFEKVENFQYPPVMEHVPYLYHMGILDRQSAVAYLKIHANMSAYDMGVGRYLNTRLDDSSSIYNSTELKEYIARTSGPDGHEAIEQRKEEGRIPSVLTHEILPFAKLYLEAFPFMKMINIKRHPVDVVHSWNARGLGERFGSDPITFTPTYDHKGNALPWFMEEWGDQFDSLSPLERVIKSIVYLDDKDHGALNSLTEKEKTDSVLEVSYEGLICSPEDDIKRMENFLSLKRGDSMEVVLRREGCYRELSLGERKRKFEEIASEASLETVDELIRVTKKYEDIWGLGSFL